MGEKEMQGETSLKDFLIAAVEEMERTQRDTVNVELTTDTGESVSFSLRLRGCTGLS